MFIIAVFQSGDCYEDSDDRIFPFLAGDYHEDNEKSHCMAACEGYSYAGLEHGYQCWCSNILPDRTLHRPGECTTICSGNGDEICGGAWRMNIFYVVNSKFSLLPFLYFVVCVVLSLYSNA